ncbi:MAG: PAS domain S-box protein [Candidatus Freyarchaeota archaeon]|nr:PAS domain S-box protein [Candidatus Jordarchaeia archaeon]MBS7268599.1 PAS domain S-box protein [Candidatus Jordarchaeia archaeon]MBS7279288.1 PAS domain S-box protein [Candidatus Jordarchaeia archaeon]
MKESAKLTEANAQLQREISEGEKMENFVQLREERYRELVDSLPQIIFETDDNGNITFANRYAFETFGYTQEDFDKGLNVFQMLIPEDVLRVAKNFRRVLDGKTLGGIEFVARRKDGSTFPILLHINPIIRENKFVGLRGVVIDITERKRMEEALRKAEREKALILDSIAEDVIYQDKDHKIMWTNRTAGTSVSLTAEQLVGRYCYEVWQKRSKPCEGCPVTKSLETGQPQEAEINVPDGRIFLIRSYPVRDEEETIIGAVEVTLEITERRRAEDALRESEHKYRSLVDTSPDPITLADLDGKILMVNREGLKLLGYEKEEELIGKSGFDFIAPEDRQRALEIMQRLLETGSARNIEYKIVKRDGTVLSFETNMSVIVDAYGKPKAILGVSRDITERKLAEAALRESEAKYSAVVENSKDGIIIIQDGILKFVNTASIDLVGYKPQEITGAHFLDFIAPNHRELVLERYNARLEGKQVPPIYEIEILNKDGKTLPVEINAASINFQGKPADLVFIRDITERKRLEKKLKDYAERLEEMVEERTKKLRESEGKLRAILVSSPDAIAVTDLNGNLIECNQAALDLHGFSSKEEVIGQSAFKYIAEKDRERAKRNMVKTLIQGSLSNVEYNLLTRDEREFPAELSASVLRDASGNTIGFVAIIKDITERKMMEEALLRSERLATIGEVAMMVGHDLRNPLTGIAGAVYYLKKKLASNMDEKTAEMFELIEKDIQYSNKIVEDLLEYSREIQLELVKTSIKSVVDDALSLVGVPSNVRVSKVVIDDPVVMVDVEKMKRVFVNIIKNSFDSMPEGGELTIEIRLAGGNLKIIFADTGRGVPPELLEKIWSPLFTTKARGLGMGLPICKRLVEAHGGSILLESLFGKGTTITITLPVKRKVEEGEKV